MKRTNDPQEPFSPGELQYFHNLINALELHLRELEAQNENLQASVSQLETLTNRYIDLYDFAPIGYCVLDESGMIREMNLKGAELLGIERKDLIGTAFSAFVAEEDQIRFMNHLNRALKCGATETYKLKLILKGENLFDALIEEIVGIEINDCLVRRIAIVELS